MWQAARLFLYNYSLFSALHAFLWDTPLRRFAPAHSTACLGPSSLKAAHCAVFRAFAARHRGEPRLPRGCAGLALCTIPFPRRAKAAARCANLVLRAYPPCLAGVQAWNSTLSPLPRPREGGRSARKTVQWTIFSEAGPAGPRKRCPQGGEGAPLPAAQDKPEEAPLRRFAPALPVTGASQGYRVQVLTSNSVLCRHRGEPRLTRAGANLELCAMPSPGRAKATARVRLPRTPRYPVPRTRQGCRA